MKSLNKLILLLAVVVMSACSSAPLSTRMDKYVTKAEVNCQNWSLEDWSESCEDYTKLLNEYTENYDSYTQAERDSINKAIGRYNGLLMKQGIQEVGRVMKEVSENLPAIIEGFMSAFDEE